MNGGRLAHWAPKRWVGRWVRVPASSRPPLPVHANCMLLQVKANRALAQRLSLLPPWLPHQPTGATRESPFPPFSSSGVNGGRARAQARPMRAYGTVSKLIPARSARRQTPNASKQGAKPNLVGHPHPRRKSNAPGAGKNLSSVYHAEKASFARARTAVS